jgi:hypothetical protein
VDPRTLAYFGVILVLVWLAGWLYLHQASEAASYSNQIRDLMRSKERLRREIIALRAQVAMEGSLRDLRAAGEEWQYTLPSASDPVRRLRIEIAPAPVAPDKDAGDGPAQGPVGVPEGQSSWGRIGPLPTWMDSLLSRFQAR